ncbi:MAG: YfhO family protein, partial [Planctomycetes bacterium]|nr:YfhO family protein [Planctomycetota bacterium]
IGLCFLGGFPQISLMALYVTALWFLIGLVRQGWGTKLRAVTFATMAVILGALLSCIQLLPAAELLTESWRRNGLSTEMLQQKRFAPQSMVGFAWPRFFGPGAQEISLTQPEFRLIWEFPSVRAWQQAESQNGFEENAAFLGLIPLLLGLTSFLRVWRFKELFPRLLFSAALLFCLGVFFRGHWCEGIPGLSTGSPKRMLFIVSFALAWLAALELDRVIKEGRAFWLFPCGVLLMVISMIGIMPYEQWLFPRIAQEDQAWFRETMTPDLIGMAAAGLILVMAASAVQRKRIGLAVVFFLAGTMGELVMFGRYINPPQPLAGQYASTPVIDWLAEQGAGKNNRYMAFDALEILPASVGQVFGLRSCNGLLSMMDLETGELLRAVEPEILAPDNPVVTKPLKETASLRSPILDMIGARFVTTGVYGYNRILAALDELPGIELAYLNEKECLAVFERKNALPPAYLVRRVEVIPVSGARLAYLASGDFNPADQAVVEESVEGITTPIAAGMPVPAELAQGNVKYNRRSPEWIEVEVNCPSASFLVISESHFPGWHARVNDREVPLYRTNHALMGVSLPPGANRVVLTYQPFSFYGGALLTILGIVLCAWFFVKLERRTDAY